MPFVAFDRRVWWEARRGETPSNRQSALNRKKWRGQHLSYASNDWMKTMIGLKDIARSLVSPGKGILAADESTGVASLGGQVGKRDRSAADFVAPGPLQSRGQVWTLRRDQGENRPPATANMPHLKNPDFIKWFADTRIKDLPLVGGKNASLP